MMFNTYSTSLCEKIILASLSLICIILGVDYKFSVLPFSGILLVAYLSLVIVSTTWITFVYLQDLLRNNKPFEYDTEKSFILKCALRFYQRCSAERRKQSTVPVSIVQEVKLDDIDARPIQRESLTSAERRSVKNIDERIDEFVKDIETRFILRWYVNVSDDPSFPIEAKVLLDEVVRRFLQIVVEVDGKKVTHGLATVFLKHVKEFRKTVRRSQKNNGPIEELYRYSHVGSKSPKGLEHFVFNLTASVLRQFINWELWNSLPCRSLVSILARKFTMYVLVYISAPGFLNYQLLRACASDQTRRELKLDDYCFVSISDVDHAGNLRQLEERPVASTRHRNVEKLKEDSHTPKISPKKVASASRLDEGVHDVVDSVPKRSAESGVQAQPESQTPKEKTPENNSVGETKKPDSEADRAEVRPKASEPVKIHESKSHSNRTWRNSSDLECISLGQDLLAFQEFTDPNSQIQELIEKKLWKDTTDGADEERSGFMWDIPESWGGEEETADVAAAVPEAAPVSSPTTDFKSYLKSSANTAALITNTMKPIGNVTANTLHNMKELQQTTVNTVNNVVKPVSQATTTAMHKIGEMQDEAAGMVEGILDFGIAGLRKGLRLTGLQENFTELTQKAKSEFQRTETHRLLVNTQQQNKQAKVTEPVRIVERDNYKQLQQQQHKTVAKLVKTPHVASEEKPEQQQMQSSSESDESVWVNPLMKESPSFDGDILLERTPDSLPKQSIMDFDVKPTHDIPLITEDIVGAQDSPDPEYEEAQDLASTIAKLRNLLQQKSSESGFTTPALSPMPQDELAKTPAEPPPTDLTKVDGAMPSLYKFCARTATGVFQNTLNTIKTALPGNVNEPNRSLGQSSDDWLFIEADSSSDDFYARMLRLLSERRAFCTVDTAYEAIDSLDVIDQPDVTTWTAPVSQFDDELDELDLQVPITKTLADVICELIGDTNTCLLQESVVKTVLLLIGNYSEEFVTKQSESLLHNVNKYVGKLPENANQNVMALKLDEMVKICTEAFPGTARGLLGETTIEMGIRLLITSLQSQKINQDVVMQFFELFASQLISACSQMSPAYSA